MAKTLASQAKDGGSIPLARSPGAKPGGWLRAEDNLEDNPGPPRARSRARGRPGREWICGHSRAQRCSFASAARSSELSRRTLVEGSPATKAGPGPQPGLRDRRPIDIAL